jgi:putative transposase
MRNDRIRHSHPAHGVLHQPDRTTVVFVTVNTEGRKPWLANDRVHEILREVWEEACGWLVGPYMLMPEHAHFFSIPGELECSLERWEHYWKHQFSTHINDLQLRFQVDHWDTRMRNGRHFSETYDYMMQNPARRNLVTNADDWPYRGVIHEWIYMGP